MMMRSRYALGGLWPNRMRPARMLAFAASLALLQSVLGTIPDVGRPVGIVLQVEGVEGESQLPGHEGWIAVERLAWNLTKGRKAVATSSTGDGNSGFPVNTISMIKEVDKSSPKIAEAVCKGAVIPRARFEFLTIGAGESLVRLYQVMLENVFVSSYSVEGGVGAVRPRERVSLDFEKVAWTYTELSLEGRPLADHRAFWDFVVNEGGFERLRRGFKVSAATETGRNGLRLRWLAESGRKYRILRSNLLNGQFTQVMPDLDSAGDAEQELWVPFEGPFGFFLITEVEQGATP